MSVARLHDLLLLPHIVCGAIALVLFWLPVAARKGGALHRRAGSWFARAMYVVTVTGATTAIMVLAAPLSIRAPDEAMTAAEAAALAARSRAGALFLLMLSLLVLASVRHGMLALAARREPARMRQPTHLALLATLAAVGICCGWVGIRLEVVLLQIFAVASVLTGARFLGEALRAERTAPQRWTIVHLRGLLVGGIGAYTAFFVFGGQQLLADRLHGYWQLLPWLSPGVVGGLLIHRYARRYRATLSSSSVAAAVAGGRAGAEPSVSLRRGGGEEIGRSR